MRSTLYLKFLVIYVVFGFLSIFIIATVENGFFTNTLREHYATEIYREANMVASDYLPHYFDGELEDTDASLFLKGINKQLDASIWFLDAEGKIILSSTPSDYSLPPSDIKDFNPAEIGSDRYIIGNYHGNFNQDMMSVLAPVINGYKTEGYFMIHKELSSIDQLGDSLINIIYLVFAFIYILSFLILLGFNFLVYRPLRNITEAATQYASGNLDHVIPVRTEDEIGYLSASLNTMSSKLKDMEDYQSQFIANVSHDFRSPLTSIKGYVEAMVDGTIPPELQDKYLKIILFETERLNDLTRDLLTLSDYDKGALILKSETFDIHEVIKNVVSSFEGTCKEKKVSIDLILATKNLYVYADKSKIQQVLYNLIDNAIKFSHIDSVVTIETTNRGDKISISVKDDGIGIPRNELNKIWERFYKSDASRGKDKKGTGLGLSIVKDALNAHDENIYVVSTEGVGTEFSFSLPKKKQGR
ncbi:MAG: sensor histidine kinase [Suipraeoptans sp.]